MTLVVSGESVSENAWRSVLKNLTDLQLEKLEVLTRSTDLLRVLQHEYPQVTSSMLQSHLDCDQLDRIINNLSTEYIVFVGEHVLPEPTAISQLVNSVSVSVPTASLIYSDNDRKSVTGERRSPSFKPEWNEEMLLCGNYIGRFFLISAKLFAEAGGVRTRFGTSVEYDLLLRTTRCVERSEVKRIPQVLYSVEEPDIGQEKYVYSGSHDIPALESLLSESGQRAIVEDGLLKGTVRVNWQLTEDLPAVDIIIPTRDRVDLLETCIESILQKTEYSNYTITVVDNDSEESQTQAFYDQMDSDPRFNVIRFEGDFNYSAINNFAVSKTSGDVVVLLNNDTEVIDSRWLYRLAAQCSRPEVGCVGAKLYYSSGLIQHAGVIVGVKGVAGHAHRFSAKDEDGYCGRLKISQNVSAVTAACLAVRRSIYEQLEGLDEVNLKVAYNDVDFCLRVDEAGYRNIWTPHVELYHHESVSRGSDDTSEKAKRFQREYDYMKERWQTHLFTDPAYNPNLAHDAEDFSLAA